MVENYRRSQVKLTLSIIIKKVNCFYGTYDWKMTDKYSQNNNI